MKRLRLMMLGMILATVSTPGIAQQPPTATELFADLSTCAQLAKNILDTRGGHSADWADPTVSLRYDPATDHCYVEMGMVSPAGLWDGQIQQSLELLATTTISQNGKRCFGAVFANDPNYKHTLPSADNGFDDANNYINRLMYENR